MTTIRCSRLMLRSPGKTQWALPKSQHRFNNWYRSQKAWSLTKRIKSIKSTQSTRLLTLVNSIIHFFRHSQLKLTNKNHADVTRLTGICQANILQAGHKTLAPTIKVDSNFAVAIGSITRREITIDISDCIDITHKFTCLQDNSSNNCIDISNSLTRDCNCDRANKHCINNVVKNSQLILVNQYNLHPKPPP